MSSFIIFVIEVDAECLRLINIRGYLNQIVIFNNTWVVMRISLDVEYRKHDMACEQGRRNQTSVSCIHACLQKRQESGLRSVPLYFVMVQLVHTIVKISERCRA